MLSKRHINVLMWYNKFTIDTENRVILNVVVERRRHESVKILILWEASSVFVSRKDSTE